MWVFDPSSKRWFTPEEFMDMYQRYDNLDVKWIKAIEVRDPYDGLAAADQRSKVSVKEDLFSRRESLNIGKLMPAENSKCIHQ
jgi:hypothetical protein